MGPELGLGAAVWGPRKLGRGRADRHPARWSTPMWVLPAAVCAELMVGVLGFSVLVGRSDEAHFRRVPDLEVRTLTGEG